MRNRIKIKKDMNVNLNWKLLNYKRVYNKFGIVDDDAESDVWYCVYAYGKLWWMYGIELLIWKYLILIKHNRRSVVCYKEIAQPFISAQVADYQIHYLGTVQQSNKIWIIAASYWCHDPGHASVAGRWSFQFPLVPECISTKGRQFTFKILYVTGLLGWTLPQRWQTNWKRIYV